MIGNILSAFVKDKTRPPDVTGMFGQANQMRQSALKQPVPQLGNTLTSKDAGAGVVAALLRLTGAIGDDELAEFGQGYMQSREKARQEKFTTDQQQYNQNLQGAFLGAESMEKQALIKGDDFNRLQERLYRGARDARADSQFGQQLKQNQDQFTANLENNKDQFGREMGFRERRAEVEDAWKKQLFEFDAKNTAWQQDFQKLQFEESKKQFDTNFKFMSEQEKSRLAQFDANLKLQYAQLAQGARQFGMNHGLNVQEFDFKRAVTMAGLSGELNTVEKVDAASDKLFKELKTIEKTMEPLVKKMAGSLFGGSVFGGRFGEAITPTEKAYLERLVARKKKVMDRLDQIQKAAGFAPVGVDGELNTSGGKKPQKGTGPDPALKGAIGKTKWEIEG